MRKLKEIVKKFSEMISCPIGRQPLSAVSLLYSGSKKQIILIVIIRKPQSIDRLKTRRNGKNMDTDLFVFW